MVYWVSLEPGWKLQDVQAGLNVVIAFICAGSIFVLVRSCWLLGARKLAHEKDVPAASLLSLNTIGETLDIIWLLRKELFTRRYYGLLLQCIGVIILTGCALLSGFIARFSTRYGTITVNRLIDGRIAERMTQSIPYAEVDTNATLSKLMSANFPQTQLLEYLPNQENRWEYVPDQWNSSWSMDCTYNNSIPVSDVVTTGNCTNLVDEIPKIQDNWQDWTGDYWEASTGWRNNFTIFNDVLVFTHGVEYLASDASLENLWTGARVRTVALHLRGVPYNSSIDSSECAYAVGPVQSASYTSMTCDLNRNVGNRTLKELFYGAFPDSFSLYYQVTAYLQHYGNGFWKQSSKDEPITALTGQELAMFYQAYMITKDTVYSPNTQRTMSVQIQVAQISIITLIIFSIGGVIVVSGLLYYWLFLFRNWKHMHKTPQSKLDWMLRTLRMESADDEHSGGMRAKLRQSMTSSQLDSEVVPLTNVSSGDQYHDHKRPRSIASSTITYPTPEADKGDDGFETPILSASFSGARPDDSWYPQAYTAQQQYQRVGSSGPARHPSFGLGFNYGQTSNTDYNAVPQVQSGRFEGNRTSKVWAGTHHVDTIYDPGRW